MFAIATSQIQRNSAFKTTKKISIKSLTETLLAVSKLFFHLFSIASVPLLRDHPSLFNQKLSIRPLLNIPNGGFNKEISPFVTGSVRCYQKYGPKIWSISKTYAILSTDFIISRNEVLITPCVSSVVQQSTEVTCGSWRWGFLPKVHKKRNLISVSNAVWVYYFFREDCR